MSSTDESAVALVIAQTKQNIDFLVSRGSLPLEDGRQIIRKLDLSAQLEQSKTRLPQPINPTIADSLERLQMSANPPCYTEQGFERPPSRTSVESSGSHLFTARALWAYNANHKETNDLAFDTGEIIEVVEETNSDWWKGRCRGREGLFPSSYVERLKRTPSPRPPPPRPLLSNHTRVSQYGEKYSSSSFPSLASPLQYPAQAAPTFPSWQGPNYAPGSIPGAATQHQPYQSHMPPQQYAPPPSGSAVPPPQEQPPKKHNLDGRLGETLAQSAAGGVGFGAGNAIGAGIIHSIF